jgi:spermidine dehydrogenase
MLNTSFETSELEVRRQLARILGPGGFERPHVIGRRVFGRIAIANADAGAAAFANEAIDQAERAVRDCLYSNGDI